MGLSARAWKSVTWREGTNAALASRFAALRVGPAHGDQKLSAPRTQEWLLIEWPKGDAEPTKYWLSTLPEATLLAALVAMAKGRWRIERDYQDLKQEVGFGDYEGRSWRGFHHHATLCIAAYGFLISEKETIPPSRPCRIGKRKALGLPGSHQPGSASDPTGTPRRQLDPDTATTSCRRTRAKTPAMSLLHQGQEQGRQSAGFITQ